MIKITINKTEYQLEYTRASVRNMERGGFELDKLSTMPNTMIPMLFYGAFQVHHPKLTQHKIDDIWDEVSDKSGLIQALCEQYLDTMSYLTESEEDKGNAHWEVM